MKKTINEFEFIEEFKTMNRSDNFSRHGKKALFEYLKELEEDMGEDIELDIIALCCEFEEHKTAIDCAKNYFDCALSDIDNISAEDAEKEALEYPQNKTQVIELDNGGIIIQDF